MTTPDTRRREPHRRGLRRLLTVPLLVALGMGSALVAAAPAQAQLYNGPWHLMLQTKLEGTRSISYRNWTAGSRPLCWKADPGQWISTGQTIRAYDVYTVLAYRNRKCPPDSPLAGGSAGAMVLPGEIPLKNYWLSF